MNKKITISTTETFAPVEVCTLNFGRHRRAAARIIRGMTLPLTNDTPSFVRQSRKFAFTLAEVLITLGIIGVVASMTLPTLIQKNQDKELISRTKKVYSDIQKALLFTQNGLGVVGDNSFLFNTTDSNAVVAQNIAKYFNGAKVCADSSQQDCSQYWYDIKYSSLQLDSDGAASIDANKNQSKIILPNGVIIRVSSNKSSCAEKEYSTFLRDSNGQVITNADGTAATYTYTSAICGNIFIDVNGVKNPNQYGRDVYAIIINKNKIEPNKGAAYGGISFTNILTGTDKLEYVNYTKGQMFEF